MKHTLLTWGTLACSAALALLLVSVGGKGDLEDAYVRGAMENDARPARADAYYRELLCDCQKQNGKANLRLHVAHQRDRELCYAKCIYDDGTVTKGRP